MDLAVSEVPDAVLLAGDVIDTDARSFEAFGPLRDGLGRLAEADIPVVAVAGNHDHAALPQFHRETGGALFDLLGVGGAWERWSLRGEGDRPRLTVDGWSFPSSHHVADPLHDYRLGDSDSRLHVGLLHCDLDATDSRYAPVRSSALRGTAPRAWVLGHIHASRLDDSNGGSAVIYPGSLQALDPGESGSHGAWWLTLTDGGGLDFEPVHLSATWYDTVDLDMTGVADEGEVGERARTALDAHVERVRAASSGRAQVAICRLRIGGRTSRDEAVREGLAPIANFDAGGAGPRIVLDGPPRIRTRPDVDLEARAEGKSPIAVLARLILALDRGELDQDEADLMERVTERVLSVTRRSQYSSVREAARVARRDEVLRGNVRRRAEVLLDRLIASEGR